MFEKVFNARKESIDGFSITALPFSALEDDSSKQQFSSLTRKRISTSLLCCFIVGCIVTIGVLGAQVDKLSQKNHHSKENGSDEEALAVIINNKARTIVFARVATETEEKNRTFDAIGDLETSDGKDLVIAPAEGRMWWTDMSGGLSGANNGAVWTYSFADHKSPELVTEAGASYAKPAVLALDRREWARTLFFSAQVSTDALDGYCIRSVSADNRASQLDKHSYDTSSSSDDDSPCIWIVEGQAMGIALDTSHSSNDASSVVRLLYADHKLATLEELLIQYNTTKQQSSWVPPNVLRHRTLIRYLDPPPKYLSNGISQSSTLYMVLQDNSASSTDNGRSSVVAIDIGALRRLPCAAPGAGGCNATSAENKESTPLLRDEECSDVATAAMIVASGDYIGYPDDISPGCREHSFVFTDKFSGKLNVYNFAEKKKKPKVMVAGLSTPKGFAYACDGIGDIH